MRILLAVDSARNRVVVSIGIAGLVVTGSIVSAVTAN
jgi:hypothetical protein